MSVSNFSRSSAKQILVMTLVGLMATTGFAQDAATNSQQAPAQQSAPAANPLAASPELMPMPQAPAPQNNAHLYADQNYLKPVGYWKNPIAPYQPRYVAPVNFGNSVGVGQLLRDGKLYLSIDDAVRLAIENNLDIAIQRYNLSIADTDVLRTRSGAANRGVNTGLVQGTPGGAGGSTAAGGTGSASTGATGGGVGGTSIGVGGAGAGVAGIVSSTLGEGAPLDSYDPIITGTVSGERALQLQQNPLFSGTQTLNQNTSLYNFTYNQGFSTGTLMTLAYNNSRISSNSIFNLTSPYVTGGFRFQLRQHMLQGFGFASGQRYIRIAENNRELEDITFRNQLISTVSQIENLYWDLVTAYESVKVNQRALELAQKTLSDDQEEVKIGTLAPITLAQAQSGVATAQQNLIISQTNLQLQQLLMKNAITRNMADPILAVAPVIPTDTLNLNEKYEVRPVEDLIQEALQARPEIAQSRIALTNSDISRKSVRNLLRPAVDVFAFYGGSGLAGNQNALFPVCGTGNPYENIAGCLPSPNYIPSSGYGHVWPEMFNSTAPDKGVGVNVNITIRNRQLQADQVRSELEYRQSLLALQQQENTISLQVRQAQFALQQNYAALQAAVAARDYADQSLVAEQKKFGYGASTPTLVLQASSNLTQAESNVLGAAANYEKSKVNLDLATAETLKKLGIDVGDAESGNVNHAPKVPGVVQRSNTGETLPQQLQRQQQESPTAQPLPPQQPQTPPQQ